jgi:hypothetical protein
MPITKTEILSRGTFSDGIYLRVKFTDQNGVVQFYTSKVPLGTDVDDLIARKIARRNQRLIDYDLRRAVYLEPWDYQLQHATLAQLRDYVRKEYREAKTYINNNKQRIQIARRIIEWIDNGRFTVAQLRTVFSKGDTEFVDFRKRLEALRDADNLLKNAEGE